MKLDKLEIVIDLNHPRMKEATSALDRVLIEIADAIFDNGLTPGGVLGAQGQGWHYVVHVEGEGE